MVSFTSNRINQTLFAFYLGMFSELSSSSTIAVFIFLSMIVHGDFKGNARYEEVPNVT